MALKKWHSLCCFVCGGIPAFQSLKTNAFWPTHTLYVLFSINIQMATEKNIRILFNIFDVNWPSKQKIYFSCAAMLLRLLIEEEISMLLSHRTQQVHTETWQEQFITIALNLRKMLCIFINWEFPETETWLNFAWAIVIYDIYFPIIVQ